MLELLRDPKLEEADAELVLTLLSEHGEEVLDRMASVWPRYPALSRPIYNFVTRELSDPTSVAALAQAFLANAPNATEYQLFWLAKVLQATGTRNEVFGRLIASIFDHQNATPIVKAKVLELADNRFGLAEMREETLKLGQSDWPSWAAAIGCRVQTKASRNKLIKTFGAVSPLNKVIADVAMALEPVEAEEIFRATGARVATYIANLVYKKYFGKMEDGRIQLTHPGRVWIQDEVLPKLRTQAVNP